MTIIKEEVQVDMQGRRRLRMPCGNWFYPLEASWHYLESGCEECSAEKVTGTETLKEEEE